MVTLIVDDQVSVVSAMISGIHWEEIGVQTVLKAYNAYDAKEILRTRPVNIMLCDIEMPGQDGLNLFRWVRENGYETECIFLTSHADFHYAKEALRLGSFDYILQPARYEDVETAIKKAIVKIRGKEEERQYYTYGRMVIKDMNLLLDAVLGRWLWGDGGDKKQLDSDLHKLNTGLALDSFFYCSQLHILGWGQGSTGCNDDLFRYGINNIFCELAAGYGQNVILIRQDHDTYWLIVYGCGKVLEDEAFLALIRQYSDVCQRYYGCLLAIYTGPVMDFDNLAQHCATLRSLRDDNVALEPKIYHAMETEAPSSSQWLHFHQLRWQELVLQGNIDTAAVEIHKYLDFLILRKPLNAEALQRFYQEFLRLTYKVLDSTGLIMDDIFNKFENHEQFLLGYRSISDMRLIIDTVMEVFRESSGEQRRTADQMDEMIRYIHDNIERDIRRSELAADFFLSPDYVSHLFRKHLGLSFSEFVMGEKMKVAQALLRTTPLPISVVAAKVGYSNFSYFSKTYKRAFGHSPTTERKGEGL